MLNHAREEVEKISAWRIEGTLREFSKFSPVNLWFDYPVHKIDNSGVLNDIEPDDNRSNTWRKNFQKKKSPEDKKKERLAAVDSAFEACGIDEKVTVKAMSEYMGVSEKTVRSRLKESGNYWIDEGVVGKK